MRAAHDVEPEVALVAHGGLSGVNSHADAHLAATWPRVAPQRALRVNRGGDGVARARKREEERVSLRVHLGAAAGAERLAHDSPVVAHHLGVVVAQFLQELRRALDVREDERDRPTGDRCHSGVRTLGTGRV
jgi:hypothetical protein